MSKLLSRARRCALPLAMALVAVLTLDISARVLAQTPQGATLTVVAGQTAVVELAGTSFQPAPSGLTLGVEIESRPWLKRPRG